MSQIIITMREDEDGIQMDCEGDITVYTMVHMVTGGFDSLKLQFCEDLLKWQSGQVEVETSEIGKDIKGIVDKIISDSNKT